MNAINVSLIRNEDHFLDVEMKNLTLRTQLRNHNAMSLEGSVQTLNAWYFSTKIFGITDPGIPTLFCFYFDFSLSALRIGESLATNFLKLSFDDSPVVDHPRTHIQVARLSVELTSSSLLYHQDAVLDLSNYFMDFREIMERFMQQVIGAFEAAPKSGMIVITIHKLNADFVSYLRIRNFA